MLLLLDMRLSILRRNTKQLSVDNGMAQVSFLIVVNFIT